MSKRCWNAGVVAPGAEEHETEVSKRMQQQNRRQDGPWPEFVEFWENVDPGGYQNSVLNRRLTVRMFIRASAAHYC